MPLLYVYLFLAMVLHPSSREHELLLTPIHHNEVEDTFLSSMKHMHMNRLMFIRVKVKDKAEIFKYLWHIVVLSVRVHFIIW